MSKKILFLDHDGVICLGSEFGTRTKKRQRDKISLVMNNNGIDEFSIPVEYRFDDFNKKDKDYKIDSSIGQFGIKV